MKSPRYSKFAVVSTLAGFSVFSSSHAQDVLKTLEPLTVLGDREEIFQVAGSAALVSEEEIRRAGTQNINQVLAKVPGAYVREEDGYGNFPNISLRGGDGTRSAKVTVMEDGILTAPAPYSAPAAYYTPRIARMSGLEVLKGSSQVRYGPQSTGGILNYLSTELPLESAFYTKFTFGSDNTFFLHSYYGDRVETDAGVVSYLLELHGNISDGFRDIDSSSKDTGFELYEPMLKMAFEPNTALKQRFEFKAGYTSFDADETYVGLKEADLKDKPNRRYAGSVHDNIVTDQYRTYLKWVAEPSDAIRLESSAYYNKFERDWFKADRANGRNIHQVLAPSYRPADAAANNLAYDVLRGVAPGTMRVKGNAREYEAYGLQNQVNWKFDTGSVNHDLAVGLRFHQDQERRDQYTTTFQGDGFGNFTPIPGLIEVPVLNENDRSRTFATAVFVEDTITIDRLTLKPGFRYEWLDLDFKDFNNSANNLDGNSEFYTAGMGASYELNDCSTLFGGIYRGISLPGVKSAIRDVNPVDEEESLGYELGIRHRRETWNAELVAFFTDFDNLISTDTGVGGINNQNAGAAEVYGLEGVVQYDPFAAGGSDYSLPMYVSATWTSAEFKGTTAGLAGGGDGLYAGGKDGNEIPYLPEWKLAAGIGYQTSQWGVYLDAIYSSSTWGTGFNGNTRPDTEARTVRDGEIPALFLVNLSANYRLTDNLKLIAGINNLFDEQEIVSRIPEGPRANAPRMVYAGFEASF